jgi:hypothetical protein
MSPCAAKQIEQSLRTYAFHDLREAAWSSHLLTEEDNRHDHYAAPDSWQSRRGRLLPDPKSHPAAILVNHDGTSADQPPSRAM